MKNIIFIFAIAALSAASTTTNAQTAPDTAKRKTSVKYDAAKNEYYTPARAKSAAADLTKNCEKLAAKYRDSRGRTWPVYKSKNGKIFALVTSQKTGKQYRKYLD